MSSTAGGVEQKGGDKTSGVDTAKTVAFKFPAGRYNEIKEASDENMLSLSGYMRLAISEKLDIRRKQKEAEEHERKQKEAELKMLDEKLEKLLDEKLELRAKEEKQRREQEGKEKISTHPPQIKGKEQKQEEEEDGRESTPLTPAQRRKALKQRKRRGRGLWVGERG